MLGIRGLWRAVLRPATPLVLAVMLLLPPTALAAPPAQTESDMSGLGMRTGADFEIHWMSMMIEHHQGAIDMANLALQNAMHQEIKDIADTIIRDQTKEISNMTLWLQQWHNTAPKTGMMPHNMNTISRLRSLTGDEFDKAFLMMMHDHHRGAIMMAEMVPGRAMHDDLKTLAQNIMTTQEAEIQQFMQWATSWYNLDLMTTNMSGMGPGQTIGMPRTGLPLTDLALLIWLAALFVIVGAVMAGSVTLRNNV